MIYTFVDSPLWYLQWMLKELNRDGDSPLEDQVSILRKELRFMRTYLMYLSMAEGIPSGSRTSVISSVESAFRNSTKDLSSACRTSSSSAVAHVVSFMLEKAKDCKQEIREAYAELWNQPWQSKNPPIRLSLMEFLYSIQDNLKDLLGSENLVPHVKENIESLTEKLSFIAKFIGIIEKRKVVHGKMGAFLIHVQVVATSAACLSYFCWFDENDETVAPRIGGNFSELMQLIKPCTSDRVDMYFELLKASKPDRLKSADAMVDEVEGFVDFLLGISGPCISNQIGTLREELLYLIKFLIESPDHCSADRGQISADINAIAKGAALLSIIKTKEDRVPETSMLLSRLLQEITVIKEKVSKIRLQSSEGSATIVEEVVQFRRRSRVDRQKQEKKDEKVTSLTYSIRDKILSEEMSEKDYDALLPLLKMIEVIRLEMYKTWKQIPGAEPVCLLKDQIRSVHKDIACLESEFKVKKSSSAHLLYFLPSFFLSCCRVNEMNANKVNGVDISLLDFTHIIKAELFLLELRNNEVGLMVRMMDQAENLQGGLRFLRIFLMNPLPKDDQVSKLMLVKIKALANEAASVVSTFYQNSLKANVATEPSLNIWEVLEKIMLLKVELGNACHVPSSLHSNLPSGLIFISSLLLDVKEVLNYKADSIDFVKPEIEMLLAELESLKCFLLDTEEKHEEHEELKDLWTCITDVAYEAEYMIDSTVFGEVPEWCFMLWLPVAMDNIKLIESRIKDVSEKNMYDIGVRNKNNSSIHMPSRGYNPAAAEEVFFFSDEANFIVDLLKGGPKHLDFVSIVGPPGLGKTTLAKKVYYDPEIASHFDVQAWCPASQNSRSKELLRDFFHGAFGYNWSDHATIADGLRRRLNGRRYLLVIDNMWYDDAWNDLEKLLPDENNGSRVLLTSRFHHHVPPGSCQYAEPFPLRLLSDEESWELVQKKILNVETSARILLEAGKQISVNCKGVPMLLLLTAGLVAGTNKKLVSWKQMAKSSREDTLELCYRNLPDHLKTCLLYFGAFPVNSEISASKLFRLWNAEGFLEKNGLKSPEDRAEDYLSDLIGRNLVTVAQRSFGRGVKTCRVHDVLHEFCVKKAKEENFLQLTAWSDLKKPSVLERRRLCLCACDEERNRSSTWTLPSVRCLLSSVACALNPELPPYASLIFSNFTILRVLDFELIDIGNSFPDGLELLELLRYLAIRGSLRSFPDSLANLWKLETLIFKSSSRPVKLPGSFWKMKSLRHVRILPTLVFDLPDDEVYNADAVLENLVSLSMPCIRSGNSMSNLMRRIPNLRKLKCVVASSLDFLEAHDEFPVFSFLHKLESLRISPIQPTYDPSKVHISEESQKTDSVTP